MTLYLDELGREHSGPGGHYTEFLAGKLIQSAEEPPDFVPRELVKTPDIVWRWNVPVPVIGAHKRVYNFASPKRLPSLGPTEWLEHLEASGANKPRMRAAREIAKYADHETGQNVRPSNQTIADALGVTRKAINRAIKKMEIEGWLTPTGKSFVGVIVYALTVPEVALEAA